MDVVERLSLEDVGAPTLTASEHLHRYELAAELCAGLRVLDLCCGVGYGSRIVRDTAAAVTGVDRDEDAIRTAQTKVARGTDIRFEVGDAHEVLRRDLAESFDALVLFEGLEHLERPDEALGHLRRHAGDGLKLLVSVPNSRTFGEVNPFHVTDFGFDEAMATFREFDDATVLYQFVAEGSLLRGEEAGEVAGHFALTERGEPEYANNYIACVNFGEAPTATEGRARMSLAVAPYYNRHVRNLEQAYQDLRRTNARLARERIGTADTAAAKLLKRLDEDMERARAEAAEAVREAEERTQQAEQRADLEEVRARHLETVMFDLYRSISWRITAPLRAAKRLFRGS
jgi:SAM-dependent methyltransferase